MKGCRWEVHFDYIAADSTSFDAIRAIGSTLMKDRDLCFGGITFSRFHV